jgi:sRNA-binding regulator protein Hfq
MRSNFKAKLNYGLVVAFVFLLTSAMFAKKATITLKNGNVVTGEVAEETPEYIILVNGMGQIKISRDNVGAISYDAFRSFKEGQPLAEGDNTSEPLSDRVVVHYKNGDVVDGFILAKSLSMVMIATENGRLTIPKKDIRMIEYISNAYAERGEPAIVKLENGTKLEGYIYHEDKHTLTIETELGRLSLDKSKLRSIEYAEVKLPVSKKKETKRLPVSTPVVVDEGPSTTPDELILKERTDIIQIGYSPRFGTNYSPGIVLGYRSRHPFKSSNSYQLNFEGAIDFSIFSLDKDAFTGETASVASTVTGGAFVTTLSAGLPIHFFPSNGSKYQFFIAPALETHIVYKKLDREFPSFPQLNTSFAETNFNFGPGLRTGLELISSKWRAGIVYNAHLILGENDYGQINFYLIKKLF